MTVIFKYNALILGLDLSSVNSGYSVLGIGPERDFSLPSIYDEEIDADIVLIEYGNIIVPENFNHETKLMYIYDSVTRIISRLKKTYPSTEIDLSIEDSHFRSNVNTLKLLARISGVVMLAGRKKKCGIHYYSAAAIKKAFSGSGKASKKDMINTAKEKFNIEDNIDDNASDSIGAAYTHIVKKYKKER